LWEQLDRAVDKSPTNSAEAHSRFLQLIEDVRAHLAMIFHRFLDGTGSTRRAPLNIFVNGRTAGHQIQPWHPFMIDGAPASKETPTENMNFGGHRVSVRGFVLPHKDRLTEAQYVSGRGPQGWVAQQGFYIYRNDRIIVAGDWLRLGRTRPWAKEEQYKLARLSVDKEARAPRSRGRSVVALYNDVRTHRSLSKDAPQVRPIQFTGVVHSRPVLGGLHHHYVRV
jgi:hypothetical protein